jgi:hypothetical protein
MTDSDGRRTLRDRQSLRRDTERLVVASGRLARHTGATAGYGNDHDPECTERKTSHE